MRRWTRITLVAFVVLMAFAAGWSIAASPTQYQYTGTITDFDAKTKILGVDKGGEIWEFATDGLKDLKVKKGDKVTVYYTMIAKKVEKK